MSKTTNSQPLFPITEAITWRSLDFCQTDSERQRMLTMWVIGIFFLLNLSLFIIRSQCIKWILVFFLCWPAESWTTEGQQSETKWQKKPHSQMVGLLFFLKFVLRVLQALAELLHLIVYKKCCHTCFFLLQWNINKEKTCHGKINIIHTFIKKVC